MDCAVETFEQPDGGDGIKILEPEGLALPGAVAVQGAEFGGPDLEPGFDVAVS